MCSESPDRAAWSAGMPHSGPATRGKSRNSVTASGIPCANILSVVASGARQPPRTGDITAGRARTLQRAAEQDDGRNRRRRGEQRLAVEERRDDQKAREADDQRSVALPARFEVLDADQREQEGHTGIAADEIAERNADRDRGDEREKPQHPRPDDHAAACRDASRLARSAGIAARRATCRDTRSTAARRRASAAASPAAARPASGSGGCDSVSSRRAGGARRCLVKKRLAAVHADHVSGISASAVSAARRWSRPCPVGERDPGSIQRERPSRRARRRAPTPSGGRSCACGPSAAGSDVPGEIDRVRRHRRPRTASYASRRRAPRPSTRRAAADRPADSCADRRDRRRRRASPRHRPGRRRRSAAVAARPPASGRRCPPAENERRPTHATGPTG